MSLKALASVVAVFGTVATVLVAAAPPEQVERPGDAQLLAQSELDFLPATARTITLLVQKEKPAVVLERIRKESGLKIEVQGSLPGHPALSASFRDAEVKDVLRWFMEQLRVTYKADPPNTLWVIVEAPRARPKTKDAS